MRKFRSVILLTAVFVGVASANQIGLVYENEAAVTQGKVSYATVVKEGVLTSAQLAMSAGKNLLVAVAGQELHHGVLVRLDNDLDLAIIRVGDPVTDPALLEANRKKSAAVLNFFPTGVYAGNDDQPIVLPPMKEPEGEGWTLNINDKPAGKEIIEMQSALRKSKFKVEVVYTSTTPVWAFSLKLTSNPKLAFWRQDRKMSLNEIPTPVFTYDHQAVFSPVKTGKTVMIPIEAHFIQDKQEYDWTFEIMSKNKEKFSQTVRVKFH